jgi:hypothetical protein
MMLQEMKRPGEELFAEYSMAEMAFVPPVKPPPSRPAAKRGKASPTTINFDLTRIDCPESMDFFSSLRQS